MTSARSDVTEPLLEARDVGRRYGYRRVFEHVTLSLRQRDVLALIGPNGAGKTTLLRVLSGLLRPSSGTVRRHGTVGLVTHDSTLYDALTARENLAFAARLWGIRGRRRIDQLLDLMGLVRWQDQRVGTFSRGMTQRLAIARALVPDPDLLLLDEPFYGLDDLGVSVVLDLIRNLSGQGRIVVIVTHQLERVIQLANNVAYLIDGSLHGPEPVIGRDAQAVADRYRDLIDGA